MGRRKHDCYFTGDSYIGPCSECPERSGCRDFTGSFGGGSSARYVWSGCPDCSYWDDYFGCHQGYERGDRCTSADLW